MKNKQAVAAKNIGPVSHVLHRDDFSEHAISIGVWDGLCEDHGVSSDATEIEVTVTAVRRVA